MPAPSRRGGLQPSLTKTLADQAKARPVNSTLSISKYYTSAELLLRQANSYGQELNEEQQFVMLMRFASLLLETIPGHKDYAKSDPKYTRLKKILVENIFPQLEGLKVTLRSKEIVEPHVYSRNRPTDAVMVATSNLPGINWQEDANNAARSVSPAPLSVGNAPPVAGYNPSQVNVDDLLDIIQHGTGPSAPPPPPPPSTSMYAPPPPPLPTAPAYQPKYMVSGSNRHALFMSQAGDGSRSLPAPLQRSPGSSSHYAQAASLLQEANNSWPAPGMTRSSSGGASLQRYPLDALQQLSIQQQLPPTAGPALGPQQVEVLSVQPDMPGRPDTCALHGPGGEHVPQAPSAPPMQQMQPQPQALPPPPTVESQQAPVGGPRELEKRVTMRDVHVSVALMEEFLAYARANTARGIESCGILAGRLSANDSIFTITTLIIPKQQGTRDTVQALNEEEIFEVQFSQELYPLGWIHTHPTQTCFLSSVDVHTQCGYQTMLDEAVAIVMAPVDRTKKCGIFRLSTPGGLQLVQRCNLRGFHQHPETDTRQELYELCGHVFLNPRAKHNVIDLR